MHPAIIVGRVLMGLAIGAATVVAARSLVELMNQKLMRNERDEAVRQLDKLEDERQDELLTFYEENFDEMNASVRELFEERLRERGLM